MLVDAVNVFEKKYAEQGDKLIVDDYIPADGEYIIVDPIKDRFEIIDRVTIKLDKKTREVDRANHYYNFLAQADYLSKYLDSNKAIKNKNIHSNNYLTFFIKKENLFNGKITEEIIEEYYAILKNPLKKYSKPKAKKLYQSFEEKYGAPDEGKIDQVKAWIKENIFNLVEDGEKDKTYLKIFFKYDIELFKLESQRYTLINIFNSNDYNQEIDEEIFGLPNDNMGLNSKKPYLENKTRKLAIPYLMSKKEVLMQKKFFDYLYNQAVQYKTNIYLSKDEMIPLRNDEMLNRKFQGYYLRLKKGKEIEIQDFDAIPSYNTTISPVYFKNIIKIEKSELEYKTVYSLQELSQMINEIFFSKFLQNNYFTDSKDMNMNDTNLKKNLLLSRTALFAWFYKGNQGGLWNVLKGTSLDLIKGAINNGYLKKGGERFNLREALKNYFEGGEDMGDILMEVKNTLRTKINQENTQAIENDKEYYFAVGQLSYYFISLSKTKNKVHSLANPIINAKNDKKIKEELKKLFKKYNYDIHFSYRRFKNLYGMVSSYTPNSSVQEELIIAGYLHSNLIFEQRDKEEKDDE